MNDFRSALDFYDHVMIKYVNADGEFKKARRLAEKLVISRGRQHHFLILFKCDQAIGDNPERPYEMTLDYASEK